MACAENSTQTVQTLYCWFPTNWSLGNIFPCPYMFVVLQSYPETMGLAMAQVFSRRLLNAQPRVCAGLTEALLKVLLFPPENSHSTNGLFSHLSPGADTVGPIFFPSPHRKNNKGIWDPFKILPSFPSQAYSLFGYLATTFSWKSAEWNGKMVITRVPL